MKVQSIDRSKLLFLLDPGHGIDTKGKRSPGKKSVNDGRPGIMEWEFNRDIVNRIIEQSEPMGIQCVDIVVQKESIPLKERVRRANELNETHRCIFISEHANAAGVIGWNKASGHKVFYPRRDSPESKFLAEQLSLRMDILPLKSRGIKQAGFTVLKKTNMPSVLTENGFMTNKKDCELLSSSTGRDEIARAHVLALMDYVEEMG